MFGQSKNCYQASKNCGAKNFGAYSKNCASKNYCAYVRAYVGAYVRALPILPRLAK